MFSNGSIFNTKVLGKVEKENHIRKVQKSEERKVKRTYLGKLLVWSRGEGMVKGGLLTWLMLIDNLNWNFLLKLNILSNWSPFYSDSQSHTAMKTRGKICYIKFLNLWIILFTVWSSFYCHPEWNWSDDNRFLISNDKATKVCFI